MRSRHPSYLVLAAAGVLALAGCSKGEEPAAEAVDASADAPQSQSPAPAPRHEAAVRADGRTAQAEVPDIGQAVAPGVAFSYRYAFTLPAKAVASVQQRHAAACERLGAARCQVVGMSYDQPGKDQVSARLDLMLAPDVAHGFGSDSIAEVEKADGSVDNASVQGDNAGGAIEQSQRRSIALRAQLARLEKRLATPGIGKEEKAQLAGRAIELRRELGGEQQNRQEKEASLATTPMSFTYGSEGLFSTSDNPFGKAAASSFDSLQGFLVFLLTAAGLLLPWLLLGALVVLLIRFRAMKQRLSRANSGAADSAAPQ